MMTSLRVFVSRVLALFTKRRRDAELGDEIQAHLDLLAEEHVRRGMSFAEARAAARREFGGVDQVKETYRDQRSLPILDALAQDLRYAFRTLRKNPSFTAVAMLTLALGIGASTAIFSVVNAVLFRGLPYTQAEQLASIATRPKDRPAGGDFVSYPTFLDWQSQNRTFESLAAYVVAGATLTERGDPAVIDGVAVTTDAFQLLRSTPLLGRTLRPEDGAAGAPRVVVISERFWRGRLAQGSDVLGQTLVFERRPYTIVSVMPQAFTFPHVNPTPQFWMPLTQYPLFEQLLAVRAAPFLTVVGRLGSNYGLAEAQAEMETITTRLDQQYPVDYPGIVVEVLPLMQRLAGNNERTLLVLFGAVGLLLLIACTNVANLQLARATGRTREIAIRAALGAGRGRLVRQILVESLVLALAGGALGLLVADGGMRVLAALIREDLPQIREVGIDRAVLLFSLTLSCVTGALFGSVPALASTRVDLQQNLKDGGRGAAGSGRRSRIQSALVVAEVALTLVMLAGAGLLVRTLVRLQQVDPGFGPTRLVAATIGLPQSQYTNPQQWLAVYDDLLGRLERISGVEAVAYGTGVPFTTTPVSLPFELENRRPPSGGARTMADVVPIGPDYFRTLQIPLIRGRLFSAMEVQADGPRVAIVSQTFARRFLGDEDPIGKRVSIQQGRPLEIVGVVGDTRQMSLTADPPALVYMSIQRFPFWISTFVVRTGIGPDALMNTFRRELAAVAPGVPVMEAATIETFVGRSFAATNRRALLLGALSGLALLLAAVGLYGLLAYTVAGRTHEIGVRMALGADPREVLWLVVGQGLRLTMTGVVIGTALSLAVTRLLANLLFGVSATDPATLAGVAALLVLVALVACYVPARRAMRVDPMVALRHE